MRVDDGADRADERLCHLELRVELIGFDHKRGVLSSLPTRAAAPPLLSSSGLGCCLLSRRKMYPRAPVAGIVSRPELSSSLSQLNRLSATLSEVAGKVGPIVPNCQYRRGTNGPAP